MDAGEAFERIRGSFRRSVLVSSDRRVPSKGSSSLLRIPNPHTMVDTTSKVTADEVR